MASNILIKGYCEDCHENIPELDLATEDGNNIFLQFTCPKCKAAWTEEYEFTGRTKVWEPPEEDKETP